MAAMFTFWWHINPIYCYEVIPSMQSISSYALLIGIESVNISSSVKSATIAWFHVNAHYHALLHTGCKVPHQFLRVLAVKSLQ